MSGAERPQTRHIDVAYVPIEVWYRVAGLNTHLEQWAERDTLPVGDSEINAALVLNSLDELLSAARKLRRRVVRQRREWRAQSGGGE